MKKTTPKILILSCLSVSLLALNHCGSADFDNPPNIAGSYTKSSEDCGDAFLSMPDTIEVGQNGSKIEIDNPDIILDLDGRVDNNGNITIEDSADNTKCSGKFDDNDDEISLKCKFGDIECSAVYQQDK